MSEFISDVGEMLTENPTLLSPSNAPTGLKINITFDSTATASAPTAWKNCVLNTATYFGSLFPTVSATVNLTVGYGEVAGSTVTGLGASIVNFDFSNYTSIRNVLIARNAPGSSTIPASTPFSGGTILVPHANLIALGLAPSDTISASGDMGFATSFGSYTIGVAPPAGQYYMPGTVMHEITECLGRVSLANIFTAEYNIMDLFRWKSAGVRNEAFDGTLAYFSVNSGTTNLGAWNNTNGNGDPGDWYPGLTNDPCNDFGTPSVITPFSTTDTTLMQAIGWL